MKDLIYNALIYEDTDEEIKITVQVKELTYGYISCCNIKSIPYTFLSAFGTKIFKTENGAIINAIERACDNFHNTNDNYYINLKKVLKNCYNEVIKLRYEQKDLFDNESRNNTPKIIRVPVKVSQQRRRSDQFGLCEFDI